MPRRYDDGLPAGGQGEAAGLYRAVVAAAPEPVLIVDALGAVVGLNDAARATLGRERDEVLGIDVAELLSPQERRDVQVPRITAARRRRAPMPAEEYVVITAEGHELPMALTVTRLEPAGLAWSAVHLRDLSAQRAAEAELMHRVLHDALTGLPGRELLMDRLATALAGRRGQKGKVGILFFDLDRFKAINDGFGHAAGDAVLRHVAEGANGVIRPEDTLARISGDEFAVLCEGLGGPDEAVVVAGRIQEAVERPMRFEGATLTPRLSIGVAVAGVGSVSPEVLLTQADAAMYASKEDRRDRPVAFDQAMRDRLDRKTRTELELRAALDDHVLQLRYQPQIALEDGALVGVEALVRWDHPRRGLLAPREFVPLAEESGLIVELGHLVLDLALAQARDWATSDLPCPPTVAVNLSPAEFADPGLPGVVERALARWDLPPGVLSLEITERTVMSDAAATANTLAALAGMGVRLAIDDFGTGYSSLSYLRLLPVDQLKLDASFVEGLARRRDDRAIVGAVVEMAHALEMTVVAEGVEASEHVAELEKLGCDIGQGFHYAAPLTVAELADWASGAASLGAQAARRASTGNRV